MSARVLTCSGCGSPVPLSHEAAVQCRYCASTVPIPQDVQAHAAGLRSAQRDREATEAAWAALAHGSSPRTRALAFALTACLPPLCGLAAVRSGLHGLALLGQVALPALSPGALLFGYSASADSLRRSFVEGLRSACIEGVHHCRQCGAPLLAPGTRATTCLYCGTDNLLSSVVERTRRGVTLATKTLSGALADLRTRQRVATLACVGIATTLIALSRALDHLVSLA